jgi:hypothetical protein
MLTYADVCWRMLTYADVCGRMRTYAGASSWQLNQRISSIDSMQELCELINTRAMELNHVNVATAFRKVLQMPRCGVARDATGVSICTFVPVKQVN